MFEWLLQMVVWLWTNVTIDRCAIFKILIIIIVILCFLKATPINCRFTSFFIFYRICFSIKKNDIYGLSISTVTQTTLFPSSFFFQKKKPVLSGWYWAILTWWVNRLTFSIKFLMHLSNNETPREHLFGEMFYGKKKFLMRRRCLCSIQNC